MAKDKKTASREETITGFVEETETEEGEPGVQIDTDDHSYQVVMDNQGRKLLEYLDEEIEAVGVVSKSKGVRQIKITRFTLLDGFDDDEDDDYDDEEDEDYLDYEDDDGDYDREDD